MEIARVKAKWFWRDWRVELVLSAEGIYEEKNGAICFSVKGVSDVPDYKANKMSQQTRLKTNNKNERNEQILGKKQHTILIKQNQKLHMGLHLFFFRFNSRQ